MHDEHFLERLERLEDTENRDALALYYDAELVRALLAYAQLRSESDRVAISLDHPQEGPFVVVARDGGFVTALGRGMSTGPLPIIPRAAVDAIRREHATVDAAWAAAVTASHGRARNVMRNFLLGGPRVSREVMAGMIATAAVSDVANVLLLQKLAKILVGAEARVHDRDSWRAMGDRDFGRVGAAVWALANLLVVIGASDLKQRPADDPLIRALTVMRPTLSLALFGLAAPLARGAWAAGKFGGVMLPTYKAGFRTADTALDAMETAVCLAAIGTRFARYRGEVRKTLTLGQASCTTELDHFRREFAAVVLTRDLDRERARSYLRTLGANVLIKRALRRSPDHPLYVAPGATVPDELAFPAAAAIPHNLMTDETSETRDVFARVGAAISALEPEEMFYPRAIVDALEPPPLAMQVRDTLTVFRAALKPAPASAPPSVGRNAPCPCGSGKKSKRCCGA